MSRGNVLRFWRIDGVTRRQLFAATAVVVLALQSGCDGQSTELNVVVFNYWPRPMADVHVNGQFVGAGYGAFGPGGTGGKISCCFVIQLGSVTVDWMLGGGEGDPLTGTTRSAHAVLESIKPGAQYLGVYLYPNGTVALDTAKGIPDHRLAPAAEGIDK